METTPYTQKEPSWLQVLGIVGLGLVLFVMFSAAPVTAVPPPPRPDPRTVELVKGFECRLYGGYTECMGELESKVNQWLQQIQPGARIVSRQTSANESHVYLFIFYEVPEWRIPQQKLPAEAVR